MCTKQSETSEKCRWIRHVQSSWGLYCRTRTIRTLIGDDWYRLDDRCNVQESSKSYVWIVKSYNLVDCSVSMYELEIMSRFSTSLQMYIETTLSLHALCNRRSTYHVLRCIFDRATNVIYVAFLSKATFEWSALQFFKMCTSRLLACTAGYLPRCSLLRIQAVDMKTSSPN